MPDVPAIERTHPELTYLGHGIFMATRAALGWGATAAAMLGVFPSEFIVHYSTGSEPAGTSAVLARWQAIRSYHMNVRGWRDIGYNFGVANLGPQSALILEGRGWQREGGHTKGHNRAGHGYCFLGNDDPGRSDPSPRTLDAFRLLYVLHSHQLAAPAAQHAHRDFASTACPGDELTAWVREGMPRRG